MDFSLPDETVSIVELAREFCRKNIEPISSKIDREGYFPNEKFREMGRLGLLGLTVPEDLGGAGMNYLTEGAVLEEISYFSASFGLSYGAHCNLVTIIFSGTEARNRKRGTSLTWFQAPR